MLRLESSVKTCGAEAAAQGREGRAEGGTHPGAIPEPMGLKPRFREGLIVLVKQGWEKGGRRQGSHMECQGYLISFL